MSETKLYKILKVKIKDYKIKKDKDTEEEKKVIEINVGNKREYRKIATLVREPEIIRIINCISPDNNKELIDGYTFIKDLVTVDMQTSVYNKIKKDGILYIDKYDYIKKPKINRNKLAVKKFIHIERVKINKWNRRKLIESIKMKRLLASSGNIRSKKVIFIKEDLFDKANDILLCGMTTDMEHDTFAKFSAYYALANTDSIPMEELPKMVVIDDYTVDVNGTFDIVREIGLNQYQVEKDQPHTETIKSFDGAGVVDISIAKIWSKQLGLLKTKRETNENGEVIETEIGYIPSAFQFRQIAGIKGNLYVVDIAKFARNNGKSKIKDAWNNDKDVFDEDGTLKVNAILTKSCFKFYKQYTAMNPEDGFKAWLDGFNEEKHGYKKKFNISHVSVNPKKLKEKVILSYQPLQSLELTKPQIEAICKETVEKIKDISTNVDSFLKYRGITDTDENEEERLPDYYRALKENKELFYDPWMRKKINNDIQKFKENSYRGGLIVDGNFQTLIPDIAGFLQYAFGMEVKGVLAENEVYSRYWLDKKQEKIHIVRFPHIANEHSVMDVVDPKCDKSTEGVFEYLNTGIVVGVKSLLPLKSGTADFDGDSVLSNSCPDLMQAASEQNANTIAFIPMDKKEKEKLKEELSEGKKSEKPVVHKINEMKELIETDIRGMGNNIGNIVNKISILWSLPKSETRNNYIKIMSVIGALTIDFVKTGEKSPTPKDILQYLEGEAKPEFMRTRYKKQSTDEKNINRNKRIQGLEEIEKFSNRPCTMNDICGYMTEQVGDIKLGKNTVDFDFTTLMSVPNINIYNETYPKVVKLLNELKTESDEIEKYNVMDENGDYDKDRKQEKSYKYLQFYAYAKLSLMKLCTSNNKMNKTKLIDYLIYAFYVDKDFMMHNEDKSILWNCFGKEVTTRFKGKIIKYSELDEKRSEKLKSKAATAKDKIKDIKEKNKKVKINIFEPTKKEDKKSITVYKEELKAIDDKVKDMEQSKLAKTLLALERFSIAYAENNNEDTTKELEENKTSNKGKLFIYANKKNSINKSTIAKLSDTDPRKYEEIMKSLVEKEVITVKEKEIKTKKGTMPDVLECMVNIECTDLKKPKEINDINSIGKLFN